MTNPKLTRKGDAILDRAIGILPKSLKTTLDKEKEKAKSKRLRSRLMTYEKFKREEEKIKSKLKFGESDQFTVQYELSSHDSGTDYPEVVKEEGVQLKKLITSVDKTAHKTDIATPEEYIHASKLIDNYSPYFSKKTARLYKKLKPTIDLVAGSTTTTFPELMKENSRIMTKSRGVLNFLLAFMRGLDLGKLEDKKKGDLKELEITIQIGNKVDDANQRFCHVEFILPDYALDVNKIINDNLKLIAELADDDFFKKHTTLEAIEWFQGENSLFGGLFLKLLDLGDRNLVLFKNNPNYLQIMTLISERKLEYYSTIGAMTREEEKNTEIYEKITKAFSGTIDLTEKPDDVEAASKAWTSQKNLDWLKSEKFWAIDDSIREMLFYDKIKSSRANIPAGILIMQYDALYQKRNESELAKEVFLWTSARILEHYFKYKISSPLIPAYAQQFIEEYESLDEDSDIKKELDNNFKKIIQKVKQMTTP